ncbi:MAG: redoxin domain-containing protein [Maribacter sp.]|uniref:redoxin domain-containing protein n=1 Tax=Maribacter sp. TaxID=1897614 RepID=UPI0032967E05
MTSAESILRSLFISVFPLAAVWLLMYGIFQIFEHGFSLVLLGMLMVSTIIVVLFAGLFIRPRARTDAKLKLHSIGIAFGMLICLVALFLEKTHPAEIMPALILGIGWIFYLSWYSLFADRTNEVLKVGNQLKELQLENAKKEQISTASFLGNPSIYIFFRGNWCPLCMAQIKEIAGHYTTLEKLGVHTVLISPQPHKQTEKLSLKFRLNFHFLVDRKNKAAKQLGIFAENGIPAGFQVLGYDSDTVMPTVVITDEKGKIIFADLTDNYRIRPEPDVFLKIIRQTIRQPHLPNS